MTPRGWTGLAIIAALSATSCSREHKYESVCQVVRRDVVERDKDGKAAVVDMELEWDPCPGDQFQVIRSGKEFAACTEKYGVGDYVPVIVKHFWDDRGYYRWDIEKLGD